MPPDLEPYDAVFVLSFGGPESTQEVMPFLRSVTGGKNIPEERLREVGEHYYARDGRSPINDNTRALVAALRGELTQRGIDTAVIWGNRHAAPWAADVLREAASRGVRRILLVLTSAYSSYASCRGYREFLAEIITGQEIDVAVDKIPQYAQRPAVIRVLRRLTVGTLRALDGMPDKQIALLPVTHSIPEQMAELSGPGDEGGHAYIREHLSVSSTVVAGANEDLGRDLSAELVFCSRSGRPGQPWLEPDVCARIAQLPGEGKKAVVVLPLGFISDHMEVVHDLDTAAAGAAKEYGLSYHRVPTLGTDPEFVADIVDNLVETAARRRAGERPGCSAGCCPNVATATAAVAGKD